jgi:hypothetical protein
LQMSNCHFMLLLNVKFSHYDSAKRQTTDLKLPYYDASNVKMSHDYVGQCQTISH